MTLSISLSIERLVCALLFINFVIFPPITKSSSAPESSKSAQEDYKLECQVGELRYFNYESATKVWGSGSQEVRLQASLRLQCMEPADNTTLKYIAEVISLKSSFGAKKDLTRKSKKKPALGKHLKGLNVVANAKIANSKTQENNSLQVEDGKAEPVFEEVAETADRVRKSVSVWFNKTWGSLRDFFSNIFTSSEKSTSSREQAFKETGVDIAGQCKAGSGPKNSLPIDDSVFDDLEPKYYLGGASNLETLASSAAAYDFDLNNPAGDALEPEDEDSRLSFFDDPKPARRLRRAISGSKGSQPVESYEKLLKIPFIFIQSRRGRILEIKFSNLETDASIKNFKRHLCDIFATNLDKSKSQTNEVSPLGKHTTQYLLDSSDNSTQIKQSLESSSSVRVRESQQPKQLMKALAVVADMKQQLASENSVESRDQGGLEVSLSVLRSINSTNSIQASSKTIAPNIDKLLVQIKQVQQISEGRMIGTAGQLGMSLLEAKQPAAGGRVLFSAPVVRARRSSPAVEGGGSLSAEVEDIGELLEVSSSFSLQLVPLNRLGKFAGISTGADGESGRRDNGNANNNDADSQPSRGKRSLEFEATNRLESGGVSKKSFGGGKPASGAKPSPANSTGEASQSGEGANSKSRRPVERLVRKPADGEELRKIKAELRQLESQLQLTSSNLLAESSGEEGKLDRLELLRDQVQMRLNEELMRNQAIAAKLTRQVAASSKSAESSEPPQPAAAKSLGLSLTQVIIDTGVSSRRKGSLYPTLEEIIQLELSLREDSTGSSISKLLRDTARVDKLRSHCKSAIASVEELRSQAARLELREPFNLQLDPAESPALARVVGRSLERNRKRLEQCKQVSQLLLRANEPKAIELTLQLIDECNARMLQAAREEELGFGPASRYFRRLRQQFTELLASVAEPKEALIDRLLGRLQYQPLSGALTREAELEFAYVPATESGHAHRQAGGRPRSNRSLLREEEEELNNNEAAGSLLMTITELAARSSVGRAKRAEVADRLLGSLKASTCSPFRGPDLDILEAMANFREPMDEVVGKVVHLARRCRNQDQYLVACVHSLEGQLPHPTCQRFLADTLRSFNVSCTVKSEILATLMGAMLREQLARQPGSASYKSSPRPWPSYGLNQVDELLFELVDGSNARRHADRKCLEQLVWHYMSRKLETELPASFKPPASVEARSRRSRQRRAVINENNFWDQAECKRWVVPASGKDNSTTAGGHSHSPSAGELADENSDVDDNLIFSSLAKELDRKQQREARRSLKLVERELPVNASAIGESLASQRVRRRHKCQASKSFGPKNARAELKAEVVNDLVGANDDNKFLARFRLSANFLGNSVDVGRMYLWHQRRMTRAHVNILGKSLWDTAHGCQDKPPGNLLFLPLFDFNLWLVKLSVGLKLQAEMGFFSNCDKGELGAQASTWAQLARKSAGAGELAKNSLDELELYPTISLRASGEASAKFVFARAGMSLASQYGYQGSIRVSKRPESCMSVYSAHQPMNVTLSSWFQLWDSDCHFWGSRNRAEPLATRWRLNAKKPTAWLDDECLAEAAEQVNNGTLVGNIREQRKPAPSRPRAITP